MVEEAVGQRRARQVGSETLIGFEINARCPVAFLGRPSVNDHPAGHNLGWLLADAVGLPR
ncbi:MAG: hypothetical protein ABIV05_06385 [Actinomycetota bacterium]